MVRPSILSLALLSVAAAFLSPTAVGSNPKRVHVDISLATSDDNKAMSAKERYEESVQEYNRLERLIMQSAAADKADGHTLETVFSDEDAADIAELMMEKATAAAAAKALYEEELVHSAAVTAKQAADEVAMFEGMAENAARELHAMEGKVSDIEAFDDVADYVERKRDMSALHATKHTLEDATRHAKESKLARDQARFDEAHALKESILLKLNEAELKEDKKALHAAIVEKTNNERKQP